MLTAEQLIAELALFEYRPGWHLSIGVDQWEGPFLRLTATVPNAYAPGADVDLGITTYISPIIGDIIEIFTGFWTGGWAGWPVMSTVNGCDIAG